MTEFLVRFFIKDYQVVEKVSVRTAYGVLASMVGIFCNIFLFVVKLSVGFFLHSISVMADAFNNLSDAGSSVISYIGVKMASKPADEDHPFGHGRIEYIAALIVSFLIMEVGFTFLKDSISKIKNPEILRFQLISVCILILSVGVKLWLGIFNRKLGEKIDSKVMMAVFTDSMGDVVTTAATILSLIFFRITGINIDGFVGLGVALLVMWAGFSIAKDTLEPLIGEAVDPEIYDRIKKYVEKYDGIEGTHDLIVHNYGPNRSMASIHAEVPNDTDVEKSHEIIDRIEKNAVEELGIFLVIHMDPIETRNEAILLIRTQVDEIMSELDPHASVHDLRVVAGENQINVIFDMVVPYSYTEEQKSTLQQELVRRLQEIDARYQCVITVEHSYVGGRGDKGDRGDSPS
ncbi:MAG: cation transporter [Hespellia sp.]|jgi:cation diffusion facilitator family transporter|nr:cation transporter [Hespellia sp.]